MNTLNDSLIGKQLDEYRIDKALGAGGMARIYRALDTRLRRYVALKVIAPAFRTDDQYTTRFEREAQSIARLDHPHIVQVYRFGEADGLYYLAMQYIEGADVGWLIDDYRQDGELIPIGDIARIIQDIGLALDYAHSKGVIHRDVKPGNIMVDNQGNAMLTDFGLALLSDVGTQGQVFGSPHYIAPEQAISSGNVVPQSDLYALGVTLFEMLTGDLPFSGGDPIDIAMRHLTESPPPPSQLNPAVPPVVDAVVLRSLAKEPHDRYQTGAEFSAALQQAIVTWPSNLPSSEAVRRPSLLMAPQKVGDLLKSSPLPAVPSGNAIPASFPAPSAMPSPDTPSPAALAQPYDADRVPAILQRHPWFYPLLFAGALFTVGLIGLIVALLIGGRNVSQPVALAATGTQAGTPTVIPSTPLPATPVSPVPTTPPLPTAVPPTPSATPASTIAPTQALPPENRNGPPPGSRRLGEFAVEGYCNSQGYGVTLVNNQADWACINRANGSVVSVLGPSDFDSICRSRYGDPQAFAIRDLAKAIQAYNWSCYDYVVVPTPVPPTAIPAASPSVMTLMVQYKGDWVALVNIASLPVALDGVQFQRESRILKATNFGPSALRPGECLRIYRTDAPPDALPVKCATAIDYAAAKEERAFWLEGPVVIAINPSTTFCYPAQKCG